MCDRKASSLERDLETQTEEIAARDYKRNQGSALRNGVVGQPIPRHSNDELTSHHSPYPEQIQRISTIRAAAHNFLDAIDANCPPCADAADAKRKVREAMMTANASIVLNGMI